MHRYANPTRFLRIVTAVMPWSAGAAAVLLPLGLYFALFASPPDYQQGETVRIMYVHVPSAWMALMIYSVLAGASFVALVWRHPLAALMARAAAPVGAVFCAVCLLTGSLWGRPMWGTYWVWDARLTSVLVLFLMYLGVIALWRTVEDPSRAARAVAILTLVGAINVPIIYFSVKWWNTLHQGATIRMDKAPTMATPMLLAMLVMSIAFWMYAIAITLVRARAIILERERGADWVRQQLAAGGR